jgi:hypothetical protein
LSVCYGKADVHEKQEGDTFGVDCSEEFIVRGGRWVENED